MVWGQITSEIENSGIALMAIAFQEKSQERGYLTMGLPIRTNVFDAYGTLFDVHSAVARHAQRLGHHATAFSELWRSRQVEYS